jgi:hypothetical protein
MSMVQPDRPSPVSEGIHSYLLEDELLLFSEHARAIYRLNPSAALIWCCFEEGLDQQSISAELSHTFELPALEADTVVSSTLSEWEALGLLGQGSNPSSTHSEDETERKYTVDSARPVVKANEYPLERRYRLLETVMRIRFSESGMAQIAQAVFAHLGVSDDEPYDFSLDVQRDQDGHSLHCNGELVERCVTEEELAPLLHAYAAGEACSIAENLIAIHAAAISRGKECIVLPAKAGNGKSTLTGALIRSGFEYCTDELVLLKRQTHSVQAVPVGIALKPGSWSLLGSFHPELEDLPVFLRPDGKRVRYLLPDKQAFPSNTARCHPIHSLVFPIFHPTETTGLDRISPAEALCRLAEAGYDMEGGLDRERVTELVGWISGISCYELRVNDLQEAVSRMAELLP